jgi:hypothetical protein
VDSTWIFQGCEGVMASRKGVSLRCFPLSGDGYGYSPCSWRGRGSPSKAS